MNLNHMTRQYQQAIKLKNIFLVLLVIVSISLLLSLFLLSTKNERIVVVPPHLKGSISVSSEYVSNSYLEEMSAYFSHLFLDITPTNIIYHHRLILKFVSPNSYELLKADLFKEIDHIKKDDLSTAFKLTNIKTSTENMSSILTGYFTTYVGGKEISNSLKSYQFTFSYSFGNLLIQSFKEIDS